MGAMKIKIVVIDLEIPPPVKRWALRIAIPVAILGAAGAAYASLPHTFASGETLTAANLNADLQNLDTRVAALEPVRPLVATLTWTGSAVTVSSPSPSGWISSGTLSSGILTLNFATAFTVAPACFFTGTISGFAMPPAMSTTTTKATSEGGVDTSGTAQFVCIGR
jgi:hypothetical protein